MGDPFKSDLRIAWPGLADESGGIVEGRDNLVQALLLRLSVDKGELAGLAHPRYGSRIYDLIGQPMDRANSELLRRYVREALNSEPRVKQVLWVTVEQHPGQPGVVFVRAAVRDVLDAETEVGMQLDVR